MNTREELIKLKEQTCYNWKKFAEYFGIPYRTVQDWYMGKRRMPEYLLSLMVYKFEIEREQSIQMCEVVFSIPNEVLYDTKMSKNDAIAFAKRAVALCYYTQNKVSLGYCAQIADMTKDAFIRYLGANGVSIFQYDDEQEFIEEMNNA